MSTTRANAYRLPQPTSPASAALATATLLAVFVWTFWVFLERQFRFAIEQQADWGHTLVIPFIAGWFVWLNRGRILAQPLRPSTTGLVLIALGVAWYSVAALGPVWMRHHNLMGMGVGAVIFGVVLAFCGWRAMRWLWFPVLYLIIFGQTVSDRFLEMLTFQLQGIATVGSEYGLAVIGYDVSRAGHTLTIHQESGVDVPVNIAEACSGMRMLVAFFALGVAMAYRGLGRPWQRIALVAMAVPTAIFVNVLRVMTLGILSTFDSGFAAGEFHTMIGMLWLIPAFFIYLGVMWVLKNLIVDEAPSGEDDDPGPLQLCFDSGVRRTFIAGVLVLVVGGIGFKVLANALDVHLQKKPIHLRESLSLLPSVVGDWQLKHDQMFDAAFLEQLGTPFAISRVYQNPEGRAIRFHLAYYTDTIDAIPHVPDRCLVAGGLIPRTAEPANLPWAFEVEGAEVDAGRTLDGQPWQQVEVDAVGSGTMTVHLPIGEPQIRTMEFSDSSVSGDRIWAGYFFIANGRLTPSPSGVKMTAFMGPDAYAYYCKVQIILIGGGRFDEGAFLDEAGEFLSLVMPSLMRSLPDWATVIDGEGSSESSIPEPPSTPAETATH